LRVVAPRSEVDTVDRLQNKSMILIVYCIHLSFIVTTYDASFTIDTLE
jgi:hypothetical protein